MGRVRYFGSRSSGSIHLANNTIVDGETFVLGGKTYEFDDNVSVLPGNILVTIGGSAAATATNLAAAITANKPVVPISAAIDPVSTVTIRLKGDQPGKNGDLAMSDTVSDGGFTLSGATLLNGKNAGSQTVHRGTYIVTAQDVLADNVVIPTSLVSPEDVEAEVRDTLGVLRATITGQLTVVSGDLHYGFEGATDLVATDVISWTAWE